MAMAAAAAARRAALTRPLQRCSGVLVRDISKVEARFPGSSHRFVQMKHFCTPPPPPPAVPPSPPSPADKLAEKVDKVLELLNARTPQAELRALQQMVGRLDAKLYYGGILFGALTAGIAGLPLYINDMENKCVIMDRKQEDIEKLVAELNNRVRVLESERCVPKATSAIEEDESSTPQYDSWILKLMSYLKGA